jgi:hypothetical protein
VPEGTGREEPLRAGAPFRVGSVTFLPIERVVVRSEAGALGAWFTAAKEPYALVVRDARGTRTLGVCAATTSLEALREEVPGLDAVLASM